MAYEDFNINLKDQLLIKYYVIKHFILYLAQYDGYQKGLALMADKVFDGGSATCEDKSAGHTSIGVIKSKLWWITEELQNYRSQLQKWFTGTGNWKEKKWKNVKYTPSFKDNILNPDLVDMYLIRKDKKRNRILLCVIDVSSKYAGLFLWKIRKEPQLLIHFKSC